jgi:hypothetical protein
MTSSDETVDNNTIQVDKDIQHEIVDASSEESEVLEDTTQLYIWQNKLHFQNLLIFLMSLVFDYYHEYQIVPHHS